MSIVTDPKGKTPFRGTHPRTQQGVLCQYAVRLGDQSQVHYATHVSDLLTLIIGDYDQLDDAQQRAARIDHAMHTAATVQHKLMSRGVHPATIATLQAPKDAPVQVGTWNAPTPLVLVETTYQPHTQSPRPQGRVLWLRPTREWDYLVSLADAGVLEITTNLTHGDG